MIKKNAQWVKEKKDKGEKQMASVFDKENKDDLQVILDKRKGQVAKEFEKVCPTDSSFRRMLKELHNIFDGIYEDIQELNK